MERNTLATKPNIPQIPAYRAVATTTHLGKSYTPCTTEQQHSPLAPTTRAPMLPFHTTLISVQKSTPEPSPQSHLMSSEDAHTGAGAAVPHAHRAVTAARGDVVRVGVELHHLKNSEGERSKVIKVAKVRRKTIGVASQQVAML